MESRTFYARWPGDCELCGLSYEAGTDLHYVYAHGEKLCGHSTCHASDYNPGAIENKRPRSSMIVKGKRNHETHCGTCGLEHAGEC